MSDAGETAETMDSAEFIRRCQEDVDALFEMVNDAYKSFEIAKRTITDLRSQISDLEDENQRLKDEVGHREEQANDLIDERDRLQRTVIHLAAAQVGITPS